MKRPPLDEYFVNMLALVATRGTCCRRRVAAIITTQKGAILSTGYNGVPSGRPHCTDTPCPGARHAPGRTDDCEAIHAEQNALLQCHRLDLAHTLYTSCAPCFVCAKLIANTPITRVVYVEDYADTRGLALLANVGIQTVKTW